MAYWRYIVALVVGIVAAAAPLESVRGQGGTQAGQAAEGEERELTKRPKLVDRVQPEYPEEALEAGIEGRVVLKLQIDEAGKVSDAEVVEGLGYGLDEAAKEAAKQYEFEPAKIDGEPASVVMKFAIRFELPMRPATFRGRVLSEGEGDEKGGPVEGVRVRISYLGDEYDPKPEAQTATDEEGRFQFREVPPGTYRVEVDAEKFRPRETEIELEPDETLDVDYRLPLRPFDYTGEILEAGTRERLAGIRVRVSEMPDEEEEEPTVLREVYTDQEGQFGVRGLEPGTYEVRIDAEGYEETSYLETIEEGKRLDARYYLEATYYDEYTVRTTARRERETVDRQTLELEEIRRIPGTGGDPVRAVQNLPGVARPSFLGGQLVVRGSTPQSTDTFLQGDEIPLIYHFLGGPSVINAEMIDAVDFYPGNYRARYGRALAGIVDLQTREPKSDRLHGFTEIDLIDATVQLEGPITEDLSFAVSGRRSYVDAFLPLVVPDDALGLRVAPRYYDYQGWLSWDVDDEHRLELSVYGSNDRLEALFDENDPQGNAQVQVTGLEFDNGFNRGQLRWEWRPEDAPVKNDLSVSFGRNQFGFQAARDLFFRLEFLQGQFRDDVRWELSDRTQLNFGVDAQIGQANYSAEFPSFDSSDNVDPGGSRGGGTPNIGERGIVADGETKWITEPAVYSEVEVEMIEGLDLIPGLRVDYYGSIDEASVSPRFNTRYQVTEEVAVKGGVGMFTQPPSPGQTTPDFGNPDLTFEKAAQYSTGAIYTPLEFLELDATVFYRNLYDLVKQTDEVRRGADDAIDPVLYDNSGRGRAYGLELLARHYPANRFFGWVAYTLSRSERRDPTTGDWNVFEFDQTHNLTAVAGYNLPWNVDISARWRLVTGNPETPIVGSVWNADTDSHVPVYGEPNSVRSDTFHQLDVRVDKEFIFNAWRLGVYLDVINVYNRRNQEGTQYNYDYSESAPIAGLPIIPTLGISGRF